MADLSSSDQKYENLPICWAILDIIQQFIEDKKGTPFFITMEEIRDKIINCVFDPGLPQLHQTLAMSDPDFVRYVFECTKSELQSEGFIFTQINSRKWKVTKL